MHLGETAMAQAHFELPVLFNAVAHFAFFVTGALAGLRRGYDFIGVSMLAMITAGGGGLIRDGLLISRGPGKAWNCSMAPSCASVCEQVSRGSPLRALPPREHHFCALSSRSRQRSSRADDAAKK